MITFKNTDFKLREIDEIFERENISTQTNYFIFGAKQINPYHVKLKISNWSDNNKINSVVTLLRNNNLIIEKSLGDSNYEFNIGLRRDIRNNIEYSVKLIKTIILGLENKLKINSNYKFPINY